jgi:hypothetical protein
VTSGTSATVRCVTLRASALLAVSAFASALALVIASVS